MASPEHYSCFERKYPERRKISGLQGLRQYFATGKLSSVLNERFRSNIDKTSEAYECSDTLQSAYFRDESLLIRVDRTDHAMFLEIHYINCDEKRSLVAIQTASGVSKVRYGDVWRLSRYSPEQLDSITEIVQNANPVNVREYHQELYGKYFLD